MSLFAFATYFRSICQLFEAISTQTNSMDSIGLPNTNVGIAHAALKSGLIVAAIAESRPPSQLLQRNLFLATGAILVAILVTKVAKAGCIPQFVIRNGLIAAHTSGVISLGACITQTNVWPLSRHRRIATTTFVVAGIANSCSPANLF